MWRNNAKKLLEFHVPSTQHNHCGSNMKNYINITIPMVRKYPITLSRFVWWRLLVTIITLPGDNYIFVWNYGQIVLFSACFCQLVVVGCHRLAPLKHKLESFIIKIILFTNKIGIYSWRASLQSYMRKNL